MKHERHHVSILNSRLRTSAFCASQGALNLKRPLIVLIGLILIVLTGCAQPAGPVFAARESPIYWPAPPEQPRIEYVGELTNDRDLKPGRSMLESIGRFLFGEQPVQAMTAPYAIASDGGERVFICDSGAATVHVFNLQSRHYERWSPANKNDIGFGQPVAACWLPQGILLVSDAARGTIHSFDSRGNPLGEFGADYVTRPCGMAMDPHRGRLYVADPAQHQIVVLDDRGTLLAAHGTRGTGPGEFNFPTDVAVDSVGRIYVSDSLNFRVQLFDPEFKFIRQIGRRGNTPGFFSQPKGLSIDSEGHLYVVDAHFETVQIFDRDGRLLLYFGTEGNGPGQFWLPAGLFVGHDDRIWVADTYNRRVQVFQYLGARSEMEDAP